MVRYENIKIIILDRDGVINYESDVYIKTPDEWRPIPGSLEAISKLNQAGYPVVVATNQAGVGRGLFSVEVLQTIHEKLHRELKKVGGHVDDIFFCPHHPDDGCQCRKPKPGMLLAIGKAFNVDLKHALFIGDSLKDFQAAQTVGCQFAFVRTGHVEQKLVHDAGLENDKAYDDLSTLVDVITQNS